MARSEANRVRDLLEFVITLKFSEAGEKMLADIILA